MRSAALSVLIVSYLFPPAGGGGVQRVLKLVKYLPEHGVRPTVFTVENPSVPVRDPSLDRDLPPGLEIVRTRTLEPSYAFKQAAWTAHAARERSSAPPAQNPRPLTTLAKHLLVPDAQVLWLPAAARALARRSWQHRDDVVLVSGPPFSQFLLALLARLSPNAAVVLDYRDEWSTYRKSYEMMGPLAVRAGAWLEPKVIRRAHAVTTATEEFRQELLTQFPFLDPTRVHAVFNGYDPEDFPSELPAPPADRMVLSYAGTVFRLTSARALVGAVRRLNAREPALAKSLEVRIIGRVVETEALYFEGTDALGVRRTGYLPHDRALEALAGSHMVLCLLSDVPGAERIYPAKIFELMYLGRPCLTLAPDGALSRLVRRHRLGEVVRPDDEEAIARVLENKLRAFRAGTLSVHAPAVDVERYHRRALAGEFSSVFREALARARS